MYEIIAIAGGVLIVLLVRTGYYTSEDRRAGSRERNHWYAREFH